MTVLFNELCRCGQAWQREQGTDQRCPNCNGTGRGKVAKEVLEANRQAADSLYYAASAGVTDKLEILTRLTEDHRISNRPMDAAGLNRIERKLSEIIEFMGGE